MYQHYCRFDEAPGMGGKEVAKEKPVGATTQKVERRRREARSGENGLMRTAISGQSTFW